MKKNILLLLIVILSSHFIYGQRLNKQTRKAVAEELQTMIDEDQKYRWMMMFGETDQNKIDSLLNLSDEEKFKIFRKIGTPEYGLPESTFDSLSVLQNEIDSINFIKLKNIIAEYGWPDKKRFGQNSADIFLLHQDAETVLGMEEMLLKEVKAKRMDPYHFAKIIDRKLIDLDKNQKYGTVYRVKESGEVIPPDMTDAEIQKARKEIKLKKNKPYLTVPL